MLNKLLGLKLSSGKNKHRNSDSTTDFSFLGTDVHSHVIPGIDDGPKTVDESIVLINELRALGFKGLITTPHVRAGHYPNSRESIISGLNKLKEALAAEGITFPIKAAAEYFIDNDFLETLQKEPLLTFHEKHILIEFSLLFEPSKLNTILGNIHKAGYTPVLAHAERYFFYHKDVSKIKQLKDNGCLMQLNLYSLSGYYSSNIKSIAESYLKNGIYDYCGSNAHHLRHIESLQKLLKSDIMPALTSYSFLNSQVSL